MKEPFSRRIKIVSGAFIFVAILLIVRLFFLQIIHSETYDDKASNQYVTSVNDLFNRGSIFFQKYDGQIVSGATVVSGFKLIIDPSKIKNPEDVYKKIVEIIPIEREDFIDRTAKQDDTYEEIAHRLTSEEADQIVALKEPGMTVDRESWRFSPGGKLASHVLGFMSYSGDVYTGRYGLERFYNDVLSSKEDRVSVNFFAEIFSQIGKTLFSSKTKEGDIVTTIEPIVQAQLEESLRGINTAQDTEGTGGIVIDPQTGAIVAMAFVPDFDVNNFSKEKKVSVLSNPIVENVYEMGSIIKPLTVASGLDAGVITRDTTYNDLGYVFFDGKKINNYDFKGRGVVPMQEILNQSLNTGVVFIMERLGRNTFREYMLGFGIDQKTGIDLPNEAKNLVTNLQSTRDIEYANISFGQGIALSPISTVRALSVLANGGVLIQPHIVSQINYQDGTVKNITPDIGKQVIKKETSEEISRMLVTVVDDALLGGTVKLPKYTVGAKTGTAQIALPDGRGYYEDRYLHSLFGYFPAYDARFLIFLFTLNPQKDQYASHSLGIPFMDMTKFIINYYQIAPDR